MRPRLTTVAVLATSVLLAGPALAQRRSPSADAFGFCREQEKLGDARACWSVWLQKYRATGSEAELAYAEAPPRLPSAAASARLQLISTPSAEITLDGRPLGMTPREGVEVPAGEHRITFSHRSRVEGRTITVAAGEARVVDVQFDPPVTPTVRREPAPAPVPTGDILDFCAPAATKGARKERVVVFSPSGTGRVDDDAELRAAEGGRLVREVFTARFAMDRFQNVLGAFPGKKGWEERASLSLSEVRAFLRSAHDDGQADSRAERQKQFLAYSLGCADYVAIPSITSHETKWDDRMVTTKDGEKTERMLSFTMNGALGIFRRDGEKFERIALLSASVPSLDAARLPAADEPSPRGQGLPAYVSGVPEVRCYVGKKATEGVAGLARCGTAGEGTAEQALGSLDERMSRVCASSRDASLGESERATLSSQCQVRTRAFELARAFQHDARKVDGWRPARVSGTLAHAHAPPSLALGREDGLRLGDAFEVLDANHERTAFYKVVQVGAGGAAGEADQTLLSARSGEAPKGARLDAYPQLGLVIAPYVSFGLLTYGDGTTTVQRGDTFQDFTLPSVVFGGGLTLGYEISALVHSSETYVRVSGGAFTGSGLNTSALLVPVDLWVEKGFYLARRLSLTTAIGGTMQLSSVNVLTAIEPVAEDLHLSSTMFGPAARVGLDVMLHPAWSVRLEAAARVPLNSASYTESDGKEIPAEWLSRDDHFATLSANLGIAKTF